MPVAASSFKQLLLRFRQSDVRAVAALEARHLDGHLFALEIRRESDERHHRIRLLCRVHGLIPQDLNGGLPAQQGSGSEGWGFVHIFKPECMCLRVLEVRLKCGLQVFLVFFGPFLVGG